MRVLAALGAIAAVGALAAPASANWNQPTGGPVNAGTTASGCCSSIANFGGVPYIVFIGTDTAHHQVYVNRLAGGEWSNIGGSLNIDATKNTVGTPIIANVGGVPYMAWTENDASGHNQLYVKRFDGSSWVQVGSAPLNMSSTQDAVAPRLVGVGGQPYVTWRESSSGITQIFVKHFNGTSWVTDGGGSANFDTARNASAPAIADVGGVPWVTIEEFDMSSNRDLIRVRQPNGIAWESVGDPLNVTTDQYGYLPSIADIAGVPYVAWEESDGSNDQIRVKRFEASNWASVGGSLNFDTGKPGTAPDVVGIGGIPYVGWQEAIGTVTQARIRRLDGSTWKLVGDSLNFDASQSALFQDPVIADVGGVPYATWEENTATSVQVRAKRLEPDIVTESATPSATGAQLTAQVNDFGAPLPLAFELGTGAAFGTQTPVRNTPGTGVSTVTASVAGLTPSTAYFYRAFGTDGTRETSQGATQTFTTLALPAIDRITNLRMSPSVIVAAAKGRSVVAARQKPGAVISYVGTQPATSTFTVQRAVAGRRSGRKCVKPTKRNAGHKRCTRFVNLGRFTHTDVAGANRFRFTGRVRSRKLTPGRYRLRAIPRNSAGTGKAVFRGFRVKR